MPKPINMPKLSDEMTEGKIAEWLKKQGDEVKAGEVVAQVETEKATLDVEAFEGGVLLAVVVQAGETAPVGRPIAWIGKAGEQVPDQPAAPAPQPDAAKEAKAGGEISKESTQPVAPAQATPPAATVPAPPRPPPSAPAPAGAGRATGAPSPQGAEGRGGAAAEKPAPGTFTGRVPASPAARKAARERGLDLSRLKGSGPGGRVVLADLEQVPRAAPAAAAGAPAKKRRELPPRRALHDESLPLSPMRKAIARNLGVAKPGAPHFYLEISADLRRLVSLREQLEELGEGPVSLNDLVLKAAAETLTRHPEVNAAWGGDAILRRGAVHVGMAVAVEEGLITPVLRDADRKSVLEIARLSRDLAKRARDRRLKPEEYQGASFTVSNLGMFGIDAFYAIINPPEAAILSVGAAQKVPWVDEATGEIVAMERCRFGLSGDHRVIDGAVGARFLQTFKAVVESPLRLVAAP
ncbi:dihydrolipoamide acetyltransferase family protein [Anaeromyxobacter paludicola]|uniref:Dihydrolipoamide acetyltransferase component of pyruvate dehydrogenase complex n=1 Tax=Anaeromyxobacter paludicola TaxID=2918171 RepID=A0ABN6N189_9BACT|nr:dihydrolipoamide acetyltransferase family protein [Anaeromyxobacter paludicola]BDG06980.1 acetyltransferase component of pyruvate dehydrogenase complex [Anaeromyxobacter paludicola]